MRCDNIYQGKLVEISEIERYVLDGKEVPFYKLNLIKWGLFYKVGNSYIDLETLKVYKLTKIGGFKFLRERSIDPRSLSLLNIDKSHISYRQIKKILKQN